MERLVGISVVCVAVSSATAAEPARPLITEVLANVPKGDAGDAGDASGDGVRHAVGDEFVEIYNPFDRPIELAGYVIEDGHPASDAARWRFEFPAATLEPGQCAVVFNGVKSRVAGPAGDADAAAAPNRRFEGALVFHSGNTSGRVGLANKGDWVILRAPSSEPVHAVVWGEPDTRPPAGVPTDEAQDAGGGGSIALASLDADGFVPHGSLSVGSSGSDDGGGVPFAPGRFP